MAVKLKNLITVAPVPEEQKNALLKNIDKLSDEDRYQLATAAWAALAIQFFGRLEAGKQLIMNETIEGSRQMNQNDFGELEANLLHEFTQKLEMADTQESIEEVKKQLEVYKTKPLATDINNSSPPARNS